MRERPAPTDNLGLVKLPYTRNCVGEKCPEVQKKGHCFTDWHHLYHPYSTFTNTGSLIKAFHDDRHNVIPMARCRHNSVLKIAQHSMFDFVLIPPAEVMATFLDESAVLADLGVTVRNMARIVRTLATENAREKARQPERSLHWLMLFQEKLHGLQQQAASFEVVPNVIVENAVYQQQANIAFVNAVGITGLHDMQIDLLQTA